MTTTLSRSAGGLLLGPAGGGGSCCGSGPAREGGEQVEVALRNGEVVADPGGGRLPGHGWCGGGGGRGYHHLRRGREAPELAEVGPRRQRPEPRGRGSDGGLGVGAVPADALAEDEGRGGVREAGGGGGGQRVRAGGGGGAERGRGGGGEGRRRGAGAGGGDDGGLGLAEQPLYGLAVGLVAELPRELEHAGRADDGHADAAPTAVHLAVTVLGGRLADGQRAGVAVAVGDRHELLVCGRGAAAAVWPRRHERVARTDGGCPWPGPGPILCGSELELEWRREAVVTGGCRLAPGGGGGREEWSRGGAND